MISKLFLSYSWDDKALIRPMLEQLKHSEITGSVEIISETDKRPLLAQTNENIRSLIQEKVKSASHVAVLWTNKAATSKFVQYELGIADALNKPIIVVQADESSPTLPSNLTPLKIVQLDNQLRKSECASNFNKIPNFRLPIMTFLIWSFALTVCWFVFCFPVFSIVATIGALIAVLIQATVSVSTVILVVGGFLAANILSIFLGASILTAKGIYPHEVQWLSWLDTQDNSNYENLDEYVQNYEASRHAS